VLLTIIGQLAHQLYSAINVSWETVVTLEGKKTSMLRDMSKMTFHIANQPVAVTLSNLCYIWREE